MKGLILALAMVVSLPVSAQTVTVHDLCSKLSDIAVKVMSMRQQGVERTDVIASLPINQRGRPNPDVVKVVNDAYSLYDQYNSDEGREWAIGSYAQSVYNSCIMGF